MGLHISAPDKGVYKSGVQEIDKELARISRENGITFRLQEIPLEEPSEDYLDPYY
ncbi:MAG: hypothetical protein HY513_04680 [Candidatus Aenigmarchaeota archaeon]|nr:hypothetical protein [Candidatus Aenigmarchaeota archaeon]